MLCFEDILPQVESEEEVEEERIQVFVVIHFVCAVFV